MNPRDFKNLIFDFGGVILNIDIRRSMDAFKHYLPSNNIPENMLDHPALHAFEIGAMDEEDFYHQFSAALGIDVSMEMFTEAWNSLILDLPVARVELIKNLRNTHRTFLLSNTNSIHYQRVSEVVEQTIGHKEIDQYFEAAYYSHFLGLRKPDHTSFRYILENHDLIPEETALLDDNDDNLESAKQLGIQPFKISANRTIIDVFN